MSEPTDGSPAIPKPVAIGSMPADSPWYARWLAALLVDLRLGIIANWRDCWKFATNNWAAICLSFSTAYAAYPERFDAWFSFMEGRWPHACATASLLFLILRNFTFVKHKGE